jgi:hypothetical protein
MRQRSSLSVNLFCLWIGESFSRGNRGPQQQLELQPAFVMRRSRWQLVQESKAAAGEHHGLLVREQFHRILGRHEQELGGP